MATECICGNHIDHLRRLIHVHSVLYYHMNESAISDHAFDRWSVELFELQEANPVSKRTGYKPDLFNDWTGETGAHLPAEPDVVARAQWLLDDRK